MITRFHVDLQEIKHECRLDSELRGAFTISLPLYLSFSGGVSQVFPGQFGKAGPVGKSRLHCSDSTSHRRRRAGRLIEQMGVIALCQLKREVKPSSSCPPVCLHTKFVEVYANYSSRGFLPVQPCPPTRRLRYLGKSWKHQHRRFISNNTFDVVISLIHGPKPQPHYWNQTTENKTGSLL